ncbi:MAG: 2OG-Fe(II) oxygenase, partial [Candidatus Sericytochromatia bacterium]
FIAVGPFNNANRKISFVVFLSDNTTYEGGSLKWSPNICTFPPDYDSLNVYGVPPQGTAVFFTSFIASSIFPVTSGCSKILIGWAEGPSFS